MELKTSFTVPQPLGSVWDALTDLQFVAECLPGATVTSVGPDGTYAGTLTVSMGSVKVTFEGTARFEEVDPEARRVRLVAGGSSALGDARLRLIGAAEPVRDGARVTLETQVDLSGRLAQLGHGIGVRVTERLVERLARNLEGRLSGEMRLEEADELPIAYLLRAALPEGMQRYTRRALVFALAVLVGWRLPPPGLRPRADRRLMSRSLLTRGGAR